MIPFAIGMNEGGCDEVCLWSNNKIALWRRINLALPDQHVEGMSQDLKAWSWDSCRKHTKIKDLIK